MDTRVRIVIELINRQPSRDFSLEELAEHVQLSVYRLDHLFSQSVGHPCWEHVILCRLELATQKLRDPCLSVNQISRDAGWKDPNYFHRYFKRRLGITPRQYRQQNQKKNAAIEANSKIVQ